MTTAKPRVPAITAPTKTDKPSVRKPRKDAIDNRARLIASGKVVLAEHGLAATLDDVARHAGVGVATAYRHFPNKQALASEVLDEALAKLADEAERALAVTDAWRAFAGFFETVVGEQARNRGLHFLSAHDGIVSPRVQAQFADAVTRLFARARREGAIRTDARPTDIGPILMMMRTIIDLSPPSSPQLWRRYLAFLLDGLRAVERSPAPVRALERDEFEAFVAGKRRDVR